MAKHPHQAVVASRISNARTVVEFEVAVAGFMNELRVKTDVAPAANVTFNVMKNGVSIYPDAPSRPVMTGGTDSVQQSLPNVPVAKGDRIQIRTQSPFPPFGFMGPKTFFQLTVEDMLPTYYGGTSATSLSIGTGSKVFTVDQDGLAYTIGSRMKATSASDPTKWMEGLVTGVSGYDITVNVSATGGTGTVSDWSLSLSGPAGPAGPTGPAGPAGDGVPPGGTTGQALVKASGTDYDVEWDTVSGGSGLPSGGTTGQALVKASGTDFDVEWDTLGYGDVTGPVSSVAGRIATFADTSGDVIQDSGDTVASVRAIPQNSQSTAYTLVLSDAGKHILHPSSDANNRTFTIPANSSVAFPIGTAITFINRANALTIAITSDTLRFAGTGATGSRILAADGVATAIKIGSTEWIISGVGLT